MKIIFCLFTICLLGCNTKNELPDDFAFRIEFGKQTYDSKSEILTRKFIKSKDKSVKIEFTNNQKKAIYEYYKKIEFLKFPIEFECDTLKKGFNNNFTNIEIEITANNITKASRTFTDCIYKIENSKEKQLILLSEFITKIIKENNEYKKLPPTDYLR
ncbi:MULTISPECIES: hypothetical protein [Flavobacterium]|uniref:hypothetical protein n=1 Tax=Flavobacterium TaxID=237 RepID=UPI001FCBA90E|nr:MULTISPECIES: hypothetical protein [Flavobacterium]UOK42196.1 hypothetical protein LZF87_12865 [Flavobacterium enshiense]